MLDSCLPSLSLFWNFLLHVEIPSTFRHFDCLQKPTLIRPWIIGLFILSYGVWWDSLEIVPAIVWGSLLVHCGLVLVSLGVLGHLGSVS